MITVKILADTLSETGNRLTTFGLIYPRFIHAQLLTHRVFSRNTASSRAIPTQKLIDAVMNNPVIPERWGKNQAGMQSYELLAEADSKVADSIWLEALNNAVQSAHKLKDLGVHKQFVNRILEPFAHISVILSGTEFENFYDQRRWASGDQPEGSQHEIHELADKMFLAALHDSKPVEALYHLPFGEVDSGYLDLAYNMSYSAKESMFMDRVHKAFSSSDDTIAIKAISSIAKCARVSYTKHDEAKSFKEDLALVVDKLYNDGKKVHWSPFEHQAKSSEANEFYFNFKGFKQLRWLLNN